mmetsp:Transcript_15701/g.22017  ORF Transcript_15701/g.22017 Transcript_15701/m.22017 type:complete len:102 (+) Transcript_15701:42-347(+)
MALATGLDAMTSLTTRPAILRNIEMLLVIELTKRQEDSSRAKSIGLLGTQDAAGHQLSELLIIKSHMLVLQPLPLQEGAILIQAMLASMGTQIKDHIGTQT